MQSMQQTLSEAISIWFSLKSGRNAKMLARLAKVSYSSVRRAEYGDWEQKSDIILSIAGIVMNAEELAAYVRSYFPRLEKAIGSVLHGGGSTNPLVDFLLSEDHARIIMLASDQKGTSENEIMLQFGRQSLSYFEDIQSARLLNEQNGKWFFRRNLGDLPFSAGRRLLTSLVKTCSKESDAIPSASYANAGFGSVNSRVARDLHRIMEDASQKVNALIAAEENRGDILVAFGCMNHVVKGLDRFTKP